MNVRELCRLLSATLHISGVDRWAEQLVDRELLPGVDHDICALDAAILLAVVVAAPQPEDAYRVVVTLADLPLAFVERKVGRGNFPTWVPGTADDIDEMFGDPLEDLGDLKRGLLDIWTEERNTYAKEVMQDIEAQRREGLGVITIRPGSRAQRQERR